MAKTNLSNTSVNATELITTSAKQPIETHAEKLKLTGTEVLCAKLLRGWSIGYEITEGELLAAVEAAKNVQIS
jgi:hypothetical protein